MQDETNPTKREALKSEIDKWKEGCIYRVALHTASGALEGGWSGAAGATVSGASANLMQALQDELQHGLEAAGLGEGAAKGIAQSVATLTAAGMGAAVGGSYGAASAATVDANNRQLHPTERKKAEELAKKSGGRYTQQQIEDAMRNSGNSALGENITAGMVLNPNNPYAVYDAGAVFQNTGSGVVQALPNNGYVDPELATFIKANTGSGSSPYAWNDAQQGKALPMPAKAFHRLARGSGTAKRKVLMRPGSRVSVRRPWARCCA